MTRSCQLNRRASVIEPFCFVGNGCNRRARCVIGTKNRKFRKRKPLRRSPKYFGNGGIYLFQKAFQKTLLTTEPSICKNEHGREVTLGPSDRTNPRPIPLKVVY